MDIKQKDRLTARIAGISRLRIDRDGPGVRTLVLLSGCPLDCKYCFNKEQRSFDGGTQFTPEELLEKVKIDHLYFVASSGGVTFGGGEPALQSAFIERFREICPKEWTIAIETSLNVPREHIVRLSSIVDYWFVDVKEMNGDIYRRYTGMSNGRVLENLKLFAGMGIQDKMVVRVPWIPGYNTKEEAESSAGRLDKMGLKTELFSYLPDILWNKHPEWRPLMGVYDQLATPERYEMEVDNYRLTTRGPVCHNEKCELFRKIRLMTCFRNGIPYDEKDCPFEDPECKGTCPACDGQLKRIIQILEDREKAGEPVSYEGLKELYNNK